MRIIIYYYRISRLERHHIIFHHNFPIYPNYHYINVNYILSQEATALGPSHGIGYLSHDSSLDPYRAEYGCGYPVKRLFELLELQTGQFDLQLQPMARQPQYYSRCLGLPLFGSAAKVHDGSSINWSSILEFRPNSYIFRKSWRSTCLEKDGEKEKEAGWRLEERHGSRLC